MNPKVGRVTPCAPKPSNPIANGAHSVTCPTLSFQILPKVFDLALHQLRQSMVDEINLHPRHAQFTRHFAGGPVAH